MLISSMESKGILDFYIQPGFLNFASVLEEQVHTPSTLRDHVSLEPANATAARLPKVASICAVPLF